MVAHHGLIPTRAAKQLLVRDKSSLIVPCHDHEGGVTKALPS